MSFRIGGNSELSFLNAEFNPGYYSLIGWVDPLLQWSNCPRTSCKRNTLYMMWIYLAWNNIYPYAILLRKLENKSRQPYDIFFQILSTADLCDDLNRKMPGAASDQLHRNGGLNICWLYRSLATIYFTAYRAFKACSCLFQYLWATVIILMCLSSV